MRSTMLLPTTVILGLAILLPPSLLGCLAGI
jgi:hypothetical protein